MASIPTRCANGSRHSKAEIRAERGATVVNTPNYIGGFVVMSVCQEQPVRDVMASHPGATMPLPALVLVHGGVHAADCWDLTIAELRRQEPQLETFAVDLPGRRGKPGDLSTATIGQWVESVVDDVERAGFEDIVIVGHSLAGVTLPGVVARLGVP